jgi:hypothetical protein
LVDRRLSHLGVGPGPVAARDAWKDARLADLDSIAISRRQEQKRVCYAYGSSAAWASAAAGLEKEISGLLESKGEGGEVLLSLGLALADSGGEGLLRRLRRAGRLPGSHSELLAIRVRGEVMSGIGNRATTRGRGRVRVRIRPRRRSLILSPLHCRGGLKQHSNHLKKHLNSRRQRPHNELLATRGRPTISCWLFAEG